MTAIVSISGCKVEISTEASQNKNDKYNKGGIFQHLTKTNLSNLHFALILLLSLFLSEICGG